MDDYDIFQDNDIRALFGSLSIIGIMVCVVWVFYKYAVCKDEEEKRTNYKPTRVIQVYPDERISLRVVRSNQTIV